MSLSSLKNGYLKLGYIFNKQANKNKIKLLAYLSLWVASIKSFIKGCLSDAMQDQSWLSPLAIPLASLFAIFFHCTVPSIPLPVTNKKGSMPHFTVTVFLNHLQRGSGYICFKGRLPPFFYYISIIFFIEHFIEEFYCSSHSYLSVSTIRGVGGGG